MPEFIIAIHSVITVIAPYASVIVLILLLIRRNSSDGLALPVSEVIRLVQSANKVVATRKPGMMKHTYVVSADGLTVCCDVPQNDKVDLIDKIIINGKNSDLNPHKAET